MRKGYIYLITNKINNKQYIGQTSRDVDTRFQEHYSNTRGYSKLHNAIQKYGWQNFKVETIEEVPLDSLDEREKYWINKLDTRDKGYNIPSSDNNFCKEYFQIQVVENGLVFDSKEEMVRLFQQTTSWGYSIKQVFNRIIDTKETFCGYHFITPEGHPEPSDDDILTDWIKTLNIRYQGKHIYCLELKQEFETIGQAAQYFLENHLYETTSKTPVQSLTTSISKVLRGKINEIFGVSQMYHFEYVPGATTKQEESEISYQAIPIFCPQLNMTFKTQSEAATYMIENKIWTGIKLKTARIRISDIIRGAFTEYKGYTFTRV